MYTYCRAVMKSYTVTYTMHAYPPAIPPAGELHTTSSTLAQGSCLHPHASGSGGGPPAPYPLSSPGPLLIVFAVPLLLRVLFPLLVLSLLGLLPLLVIGVPLGLLRPPSLVLRRAGTTPTGRCTPRGGQHPCHPLAEVRSHEPVSCE